MVASRRMETGVGGFSLNVPFGPCEFITYGLLKIKVFSKKNQITLKQPVHFLNF